MTEIEIITFLISLVTIWVASITMFVNITNLKSQLLQLIFKTSEELNKEYYNEPDPLKKVSNVLTEIIVFRDVIEKAYFANGLISKATRFAIKKEAIYELFYEKLKPYIKEFLEKEQESTQYITDLISQVVFDKTLIDQYYTARGIFNLK